MRLGLLPEKIVIIGLQLLGFTTSKLQDLQNTKTRDQYCKVGTDFIVFCLGVVTGDVKGYEITYPEEFAVAGRRLLAALHSATVEPRIKALQNFLYLLFTQIRPGGVSKHSILPYSFLILFAYNVDGTLKPCDFFSQDFSKVIFFARAAMFNSIMDICKAEDRGFYEYVCILFSTRTTLTSDTAFTNRTSHTYPSHPTTHCQRYTRRRTWRRSYRRTRYGTSRSILSGWRGTLSLWDR
jgi:hypothetical protein